MKLLLLLALGAVANCFSLSKVPANARDLEVSYSYADEYGNIIDVKVDSGDDEDRMNYVYAAPGPTVHTAQAALAPAPPKVYASAQAAPAPAPPKVYASAPAPAPAGVVAARAQVPTHFVKLDDDDAFEDAVVIGGHVRPTHRFVTAAALRPVLKVATSVPAPVVEFETDSDPVFRVTAAALPPSPAPVVAKYKAVPAPAPAPVPAPAPAPVVYTAAAPRPILKVGVPFAEVAPAPAPVLSPSLTGVAHSLAMLDRHTPLYGEMDVSLEE